MALSLSAGTMPAREEDEMLEQKESQQGATGAQLLLPPQDESLTSPAPDVAQRENKRLPVWAVVLITSSVVLVVIVVAVVAFVLDVTHKIVQDVSPLLNRTYLDYHLPVQDFYEQLLSHEYSQAEKYLSVEMKSRYNAEELRRMWEAFEADGSRVESNIAYPENTKGNTSTVMERISTTKGEIYTIYVTVIWSGDASRWFIAGASPGLMPGP